MEVMSDTNLTAEDWAGKYGDSLFAYALSAVGDPSTAEELVQETYLAGIKAAGGFRGRSTVKSWLTGILKHKIADHFRRVSRLVPLDESMLQLGWEAPENIFDAKGRWVNAPVEWPATPEAETEKSQLMEILRVCVEALPEKYGHVFRMREIEEMETEEVCNLLEITPTNLWVIMHRTRSRLRACMEKHLTNTR